MQRLNIFSTNDRDHSTQVRTAVGHCIDGLFDLHSAGGPNIFGYGDPDITQAIADNLGSATSSFWKLKHHVWDQLGDSLDSITGSRYVSYLPALTGSDAVDHALRLVWEYHGGKRHTILVRHGSYHSGSITGWQMLQSDLTSSWPQIEFVQFFDDLEQQIEAVGSDHVAAVLVDTVPWVDSLHQESQSYWTQLQETVEKHGLILCVDEVLTGMGRMGHWLHSHALGLAPNMVILGKALAGGHENLACVLLDDRVFRGIKDVWLAMGNTRSINTMGAIVAQAVIRKMQRENTLGYLNQTVIPYIRSLEVLFRSKGYDVTAAGTMLQAKIPNITDYEQTLNARGLYHRWEKFWHLSFYDITRDEISHIKQTLEETL